jgi:hypothetical protein
VTPVEKGKEGKRIDETGDGKVGKEVDNSHKNSATSWVFLATSCNLATLHTVVDPTVKDN